MDQNQGAQIDEDNIQQVCRGIQECKVDKDYQDTFATILLFPIPSSTNYLQEISANCTQLKQQLEKYKQENQINLSFYDSFNYSIGSSFDSQNSMDQSEESQLEVTEERNQLLEVYEYYYPVPYSKEQIQKIIQSIQKVEKKGQGQQFIDQVYQKYRSIDGKIQYEEFAQKIIADILFLIRQMHQEQQLLAKMMQDKDKDDEDSDSKLDDEHSDLKSDGEHLAPQSDNECLSPSSDNEDSNMESDNEGLDTESDNEDSNTESDNEDSNTQSDNEDSNSESDNEDSNTESDNENSNTESDNEDSNTESDDSNSESDNEDSNPESGDEEESSCILYPSLPNQESKEQM